MSNSQIGEKLDNIRHLLNIEDSNKDTKNKGNQKMIFKTELESKFSYNRILFGAPGTGNYVKLKIM